MNEMLMKIVLTNLMLVKLMCWRMMILLKISLYIILLLFEFGLKFLIKYQRMAKFDQHFQFSCVFYFERTALFGPCFSGFSICAGVLFIEISEIENLIELEVKGT